ncbi:hypothetical protein HPP92_019896 [Vanilla planifolia]|uniref:Uncharacterized protein n=1 Tax=Vanilla planifolia TaxID=51239 RepID=A0A835Q9P0_VANPL|nr:hypothetical protein HPP92_019896 [Vanilla planifolia]
MQEMELNDSAVDVSSSLGYKLVPWMNWFQWNNVRTAIFSSSPSSVATALRRISAWQSRGCLPVAVDVTARIIEIQQKDPFFRGGASDGDNLISDEMLAMLYCMSIIRLVNGFVEPAHKKTGRSISDLAEAVGIPRTLVDIRHESSHRYLPALKLVRLASIKALEWLKANYWEPQRIAIPDPRKEIKSTLSRMILCLRSHHISRESPMKTKRKRARGAFLVPCYKLSHINESMLASKSQGSSKQWSKITKIAAQLYSLYPEEFTSLLLDFFPLQALDIPENMEIHSDDSECSIPKPPTNSFTDLKLIITTLSNKKPRLLLSMLKMVLEMIEQKESKSYENGALEKQIEINQTCHLRSLVPYLIRNLKALKNSGEYEDRFLAEKLKKLPLLGFLELDSLETMESMLVREEDSINQAAEKLVHIKLFLKKRYCTATRQESCNSDDRPSKWTVAKSWIPCPIATLPCFLSSAAIVPVLDLYEEEASANKFDAEGNNLESSCPEQVDKIVSDFESFGEEEEEDDDDEDEDDDSTKKFDQVLKDSEDAFSMEGRLLIDGVWKKETAWGGARRHLSPSPSLFCLNYTCWVWSTAPFWSDFSTLVAFVPPSHEEQNLGRRYMDLFSFHTVQPLMDLFLASISLVFVLGVFVVMTFILASVAFFRNFKSWPS